MSENNVAQEKQVPKLAPHRHFFAVSAFVLAVGSLGAAGFSTWELSRLESWDDLSQEHKTALKAEAKQRLVTQCLDNVFQEKSGNYTIVVNSKAFASQLDLTPAEKSKCIDQFDQVAAKAAEDDFEVNRSMNIAMVISLLSLGFLGMGSAFEQGQRAKNAYKEHKENEGAEGNTPNPPNSPPAP